MTLFFLHILFLAFSWAEKCSAAHVSKRGPRKGLEIRTHELALTKLMGGGSRRRFGAGAVEPLSNPLVRLVRNGQEALRA